MVCSCTTTVPSLTTLSWSYGLEQTRGPGQEGYASYLITNLGDCAYTRDWGFGWIVYGNRMVACPAGYFPDGHNPPEGCSRRALCPVEALTPYIPDPYPLDIGNLTPRMQTALQCLQTAIRNAGGTSSVGSAYRPLAYNQHLRDVWNKWNELLEETNPACQTLPTDVQNHFRRHNLLESQSPVLNSLHTRGEAFDLTSSLPYANLDALAQGCQVYRNIPVRDRVHFIHR